MSGKIEISRELVQRIADHCKFCKNHVYLEAIADIEPELRALLAAPVVERQEPVHMVRSHGSDCWEEISGESLEMCRCQPDEYEIRALYTSPRAPVAVVLPARREPSPEKPYLNDADHEWNSCIDKVKELNQWPTS